MFWKKIFAVIFFFAGTFYAESENNRKSRKNLSKKISPFERDKHSRHAQYHKTLLPVRSLNERALGTRSKTKRPLVSVLDQKKDLIAT